MLSDVFSKSTLCERKGSIPLHPISITITKKTDLSSWDNPNTEKDS